MTGNEIRAKFLRYFEERGHQVVQSSPLIPRNDPTLFFTNAGMVQFKEVFTGAETRDYTRAATAQKVMRVSGKHNDLENVGATPRHHTFFEMLGNFSFGDYFKKDAIRYAWDLLINVLGLNPDTLWITVFREDDDAERLWIEEAGVRADRIVRMDEAENFWSMGDTGPCGPCSEIHFDRLHGVGPDGVGPDQDPDRFLEIWNLVFMQFERHPDGTMTPLPRPSIDTGMGLERIAAVLQGKVWNYDTDLFQPIIQRTAELAGITYGASPEQDTSLRVIADHSRAAAFLIADGVLPSKESRGYVLRRIMRRAIRHGVKLGFTGPFFFEAVDAVISSMSGSFPELASRREAILSVVRREEERFAQTLGNGLRLFRAHAEEVRAAGGDTVAGETAFKLYDTYGFPLDLTQVIAEEEGLHVDLAGFQAAMEEQRSRARKAWVGSGEARVSPVYRELAEELGASTFLGYDTLTAESAVLAIIKGGARVDTASAGDEVEIVVEETPFYGESGGQVGDRGVLSPSSTAEGALLVRITDTQKPVEGLIVHKGQVDAGQLTVGASITLAVDGPARAATRRNHTATHLLHAALKEVLGAHVAQRGSLVGPDRLRFDFSHFQPVSREEIDLIEDKVNHAVLDNIALSVDERSLDEAMQAGVVALFGEKYGDRVRVVAVPGVSAELCGGTHVGRTGDIGLFKIVGEVGIAAGVRRLEAQTGLGALAVAREQEALLRKAAEALKAKPSEVPERVSRLQETHRKLEAEVSHLKASMLGGGPSASVEDQVVKVSGISLLALRSQADSAGVLREQADRLRDSLGSGVVILAADAGGKATLLAAVTKDLTGRISAGDLIKKLAPILGGRGGGRPDLAQAGGPDVSKLDDALKAAAGALAELAG